AAPRVDVARDSELEAERADDAGLLQDLTEGALLVALARLVLPLRQCPVVVTRPVHEQHLEPGPAAPACDHASGRPHRLCWEGWEGRNGWQGQPNAFLP